MRILLWPIHGGYTDAFVRGGHEYLLPVGDVRPGEDDGVSGWGWERVRAVAFDALRAEHIDAVVLQRPEEIELVETLTGRVPGRDLPAVYLEHNTPGPAAFTTRHPLADQGDIPIVHVTHFNRLFWDSGAAPTTVVEHGVPDPGPLYSGELARIGVVVNEPVRRWRATGTAVAAGRGVVSTDVDDLRRAARAFLEEPEWAKEVGARAREHALTHYGLPAFVARWDEVLREVIAARPGPGVVYANANSGGNATTTIAAHAR